MENLHHKGYYGSVEYSEEDKCFCGQILGLKNNLILYEGGLLEELKTDFEEGVDNYFERCMQRENEPEKPFNGLLNICIPPDSHIKIDMYAENKEQLLIPASAI
jgi:predicted HicB family RNase H-like nuclease